ncbi:phage adaptor protein [Sphingomonas melonis]|uniref:phage adaptor protein n=1 Tax=Sphingomonas melonis TaxID=152682 RepID=UPI0036CAD2F7
MAVALDLGSYSDISDYSSLVEKAKLWLDRGSELDTLIPTFIANTEGHLNRVLRTPEMEAFAPMTAVAGSFTLPADCIQVRSLTVAGQPLAASSPVDLATRYYGRNNAYVTGCPAAYAISGRQVQVAPVSDGQIALSYWQRIPALTVNQPSNWLLDNHADIYLFGTLFHANTYIVDTDAAAGWSTLFDAAVGTLQDAGQRARYGGPIVARSGVRPVYGVRC